MIILFAAALTVFFSPLGGTQDEIIKQINHSKVSVCVQAYSFTSQPIKNALTSARERGVDVRVILDKSWPSQSRKVEPELVAAGIPVFIDWKHAIAHNKVIIIDDKLVLTGSYNFTWQAEHSNAENLVEIRNKKIVAAYLANWQLHVEHSRLP